MIVLVPPLVIVNRPSQPDPQSDVFANAAVGVAAGGRLAVDGRSRPPRR